VLFQHLIAFGFIYPGERDAVPDWLLRELWRRTEAEIERAPAPTAAMVEGEPCEIWPFLGSSRLEGPINRLGATFVLHGHAHQRSPKGRTASGIPVYNVSMPLLKKHFPYQPPFRLIELPVRAAFT
jgi:hypothetical protein